MDNHFARAVMMDGYQSVTALDGMCIITYGYKSEAFRERNMVLWAYLACLKTPISISTGQKKGTRAHARVALIGHAAPDLP